MTTETTPDWQESKGPYYKKPQEYDELCPHGGEQETCHLRSSYLKINHADHLFELPRNKGFVVVKKDDTTTYPFYFFPSNQRGESAQGCPTLEILEEKLEAAGLPSITAILETTGAISDAVEKAMEN